MLLHQKILNMLIQWLIKINTKKVNQLSLNRDYMRTFNSAKEVF